MMSDRCQSLTSPRRTFLSAAATVVGAASIPSWGIQSWGYERQNERSSWIDAHVHVWPKLDPAYPLAEEFAPDVVQPASFTPDELFAHCRPFGVDRIVLIQMNFFGFDNRYMLDVIRQYPGVFSGVAVIDHDQPELRSVMADLHKQGVRGYRLYATADNVAKWKSSKSMDAMFRFGSELGQAICMLSDPDAIPGIDLLCSRHPDTTVVIDHFSRIGMRGPATDTDLETLCRLARFPKVYVKTSAFYALGNKQPPYKDLIPMNKRVVDAFGPKRLMWASDCPYQVQLPHTYEASVALIRDHLDFLNQDEREEMLQGTAERIFFG